MVVICQNYLTIYAGYLVIQIFFLESYGMVIVSAY